MALLKRVCVHIDHEGSTGTSDDSAGTNSKKRTVTRKTIEGWISQYDKEFHTMRWLEFSMQADEKHVAEVKCNVCCEFKERLISLRNYLSTFFKGTDNVRLSAVGRPCKIGHAHESDGSLLHQDSSAEPSRICSHRKSLCS